MVNCWYLQGYYPTRSIVNRKNLSIIYPPCVYKSYSSYNALCHRRIIRLIRAQHHKYIIYLTIIVCKILHGKCHSGWAQKDRWSLYNYIQKNIVQNKFIEDIRQMEIKETLTDTPSHKNKMWFNIPSHGYCKVSIFFKNLGNSVRE